jgi:hypothetical protein
LRGSLALEIPSSELSSHVLDKIIDEILNNPEKFKWEGPAGLASCLSFVNSEGCPLLVEPAILFESLYPKTTFKDRLHSELSGGSDFRRLEVGAGGVREG